MKKHILPLALTAAVCLCGCAKNYLDTRPQSSLDQQVILSSTATIKLAVNGMNRLMYRQYLGSQGINGEGTIKLYYGNCPGADYHYCGRTGMQNIINSRRHDDNNSLYDYFPWFYYYKLINNANLILEGVDTASGPANERNYYKAQMLTFRAYSYFMLSQLYCVRWADSDNGKAKGLPLRLDSSSGKLRPSTLEKVYQQVYADLDAALLCFSQSNIIRANKYEVNQDVAQAIYARAALTRQDWATAAKYAALVRAKYPLMKNKEYTDGFNTPNSEWIWASFGGKQQKLYYYGFFAYQGSDANTSSARAYPIAISKELYDKIPETDIRRTLFAEPNPKDNLQNFSVALKPQSQTYKDIVKNFGTKIYKTSSKYPYMQVKFRCGDGGYFGSGDILHFRSAEMYLTEAEALYHLNQPEQAQKLLVQLNADTQRNPNYTCTATGENLLEEIRLYRRIELWGEGFDWFDLKRWNLPRVRHTSEEGGSFHSLFAGTLAPNEANNWTWVYPNRETNYNEEAKLDPILTEAPLQN